MQFGGLIDHDDFVLPTCGPGVGPGPGGAAVVGLGVGGGGPSLFPIRVLQIKMKCDKCLSMFAKEKSLVIMMLLLQWDSQVDGCSGDLSLCRYLQKKILLCMVMILLLQWDAAQVDRL